jgi:hypothetical protein
MNPVLRMHLTRAPKSAPMSRSQFEAALREWLPVSEATIGHAGQGQTPWVWVMSESGDLCHLNSNTTWTGVCAYVELANQHSPLVWKVVANAQGVENKVAFGPDLAVIPGFYLYRPMEQ